MKCTDAEPLFSAYMDHAMTGKQMREVSSHLEECDKCRSELTLLSNTQMMIAELGRKQPPPDLALKLRVRLSQELARSRRRPFEGLIVRVQNAVHAFMVPATAGVVTAIIVFGLLIGVLYPVPIASANDVPTALYTPPELAWSPFGMEMGTVNTDSLVVEADIDQNGRVQEYRILSAPENAKNLIPELNRMLIFTQFRPATAFGKPTTGRAVLSFAAVNVRG
jgi:hypothetical protein